MIIVLAVWALCAAGCASMAEKKGYEKGTAIVLGLLFGVFAIAGYMMATDKNRARSNA